MNRSPDLERLDRQEQIRRHLADVHSRNPKCSFDRKWQIARQEKPHLFTPDEQGEPVPGTEDENDDLVQPQRDFNSMSGPNPPVDRAARLRTHASHAGGQLIEHKMAVVRQRIKDMQHADPKLRFQVAWDSLRATHPDLFSSESEEPELKSSVSALAELVRLHMPGKIEASASQEKLWLFQGGTLTPYNP